MSENYHGLLEDCEIRLTDKTDPSDPTRREFIWLLKLKTLASLGFNEVEGVKDYYFIIVMCRGASVVCLGKPCSGGLGLEEIIQFNCIVNQLTGYYMMRVFAERCL